MREVEAVRARVALKLFGFAPPRLAPHMPDPAVVARGRRISIHDDDDAARRARLLAEASVDELRDQLAAHGWLVVPKPAPSLQTECIEATESGLACGFAGDDGPDCHCLTWEEHLGGCAGRAA